MKRVIFIRSYRGDLAWLRFTLRALGRFAEGFDGVIVVVPWRDLPRFAAMIWRERRRIPRVRLRPTRRFPEDYIGQQCTKLHADRFTGPGCAITFLDSESILTAPLSAGELFEDGRPIFICTPYAAFRKYYAEEVDPSPDGRPRGARLSDMMSWQPLSEQWLGEPVSCEFMRRLPITVHARHLAELRRWFRARHGVGLRKKLRRMKGRHFSEFNLLGAWLHRYRRDEYRWLDTERETPRPMPIAQYWSWGGLTPEIEAEIEGLLREPSRTEAAVREP